MDHPSSPLQRSPKAKYRVVADQLLSQIEEGVWGPGERLPSEDKLTTEMEVSLGTVQRALRDLAEMGIVERRHGAGTFVSGSRAPERHLKHFRFRAEGGSKILPVYFKVLSVELTADSGPWSTFLGHGEAQYVHVERLVSVNREFEMFSEVYLPASRFGSIAALGKSWLDGVSFRDMLIERFNAPTLNTMQTILCQALPPRITQHIGMPPGQFGMVWTICGASYRDVPITWQRVFVPPSDRGIEISAGPSLDGG